MVACMPAPVGVRANHQRITNRATSLRGVRTHRGITLVPRTASVDVSAAPASVDDPMQGPAGRQASPQQSDASSVSPVQQSEQHSQQQQGFVWTKHWWPVAPLSYLDATRPTAVTLLGHTYVVWRDPTAQRWRLMEDRCPHRLAPLSEGRIDEDGTLMCSYHGWQFNGSGACTRIPQIGDPDKMSAACSSPRACVAAFPTCEEDGVLFAWLEAGPAAEAEAAAAPPPYIPPELAGRGSWHMTQPAVDYVFWLEQGMDPTHANFLHHTCGFPMSDALPMPGEVLKPSDVDLQAGYTWRHGNYSKKNSGMSAVRQFVPPNALRCDCLHVTYDRGFVRGFGTMGVPVRPGVSRVFGKFAFGPAAPPKADGADKQQQQEKTEGQQQQQQQQDAPPPRSSAKAPSGLMPLLFKVMAKMPHWARPYNPLADQDSVVNAKQEEYMRAAGLTTRAYAAFARADQGVLAAHRWFEAAGYDDMWRTRLGPGADTVSDVGAGTPGGGARYDYRDYSAPVDESAYFNWYERHTRHCAECQSGMRLVTAAADAAAVVAAVLAIVAAAAAVAARSLTSPGALVAAAAAAGAVWLRTALLEFRHTAFVSSQRRWRRDGGLSLVQGDPIVLPTPFASPS